MHGHMNVKNLNKNFNIKTHGKNKSRDLQNLLQKMHQNTNTINFWKLSNFIFNLRFYIQLSQARV